MRRKDWLSVDGDLKIGVLALQGGFSLHMEKLRECGVSALEVRYPDQIKECDGLIIPGGESTTMSHLIKEQGLLNSLLHFHKPIFGTCAGLILLTKWGFLDVAIQRNAYGRQASSFQTTLELISGEKCKALFIRAPKILRVLSEKVKVLARYDGEPVLVQQGGYLGASFHPELTSDTYIHHYFTWLVHAHAL